MRAGIIVGAVLAFSGCQSVVDGAKEQFSYDFTCPKERVEARPRPELHPSQFEQAAQPPPEVAADPGRLKMWQSERDKVRTTADSWNDIYEARGCGHQQLYACHRNQNKGSMSCTTRDYFPGMTKW